MSILAAKKCHSFSGHTSSLYTLEAIDECRFLSSGGDGSVVLWDLKAPDAGTLVAKVKGSIYALEYDLREGYLYVGHNYQGIHKVSLNSKKEIASVRLDHAQIFDIKMIGDHLWVGLSSGALVILSKELKQMKQMRISSSSIRSISYFGSSVSVACSDHSVRILDAHTFEEIHTLEAHKNSVFNASFHTSGKYLASVGRDATIKIWDATAKYALRESIVAHIFSINHLSFRTDGRYFATASMDKTIKIWDAYNFELLKVLDTQRHEGHTHSVNKLLWMKEKDFLISCGDDRSIIVWEINFAPKRIN